MCPNATKKRLHLKLDNFRLEDVSKWHLVVMPQPLALRFKTNTKCQLETSRFDIIEIGSSYPNNVKELDVS